MKRYTITARLAVAEEASPRYADLTAKESERGGRCIGGDKGDLYFSGYYLEGGETVLVDPVLATRLDDLTQEEANDIAEEVLREAYHSIGREAVEHS